MALSIMAAYTRAPVGLLTRLRGPLGEFPRLAFLALSPDELRLFPDAAVLQPKDWDRGQPRADLRFDIIISGAGTFSEAERRNWLDRLTASCRALLLMVPLAEEFVWGSLGDRLLAEAVFVGSPQEPESSACRLVLIRGQLDAPLIRMDDYPTGVRPLLPDLSPIHAILESFEARGLAVHLGVVPALLSPPMLAFLRSLKHWVPALHGYDHQYFRHAPRLVARQDPYNEYTGIAQFNEFRWQLRSTVRGKLREAQGRLEQEFARPVRTYIPPCNRLDRGTAQVLAELGFNLCLSEQPVPGGVVPWLKSDFYGHSSQFLEAARPEVFGLHLTWEWDLQRRGDSHSLPRLLDAIEAQRSATQASLKSLAAAVSSLQQN